MSVTANPGPRQPDSSAARGIALVAVAIVLAAGWLVPSSIDPRAQRSVAIATGTIILWATQAVHPAWAGLGALAALFATGLTGIDAISSGFRGETVWFLTFAMIIGAMATRSGLAERLAFTVAARAGRSYSLLLLGFITVDLLLTFIVPSGIARVTILAAIVLGLVDAAAIRRDDPAARGLMLAVTYSGGLFDKMLLAGATAILASGLIERFTGERLSYAQWLIAFAPAHLVTILLCWAFTLRMYPDRGGRLDNRSSYFRARLATIGPWTPVQKRTAALLSLAVFLWMTDALHQVRPAVVAGVVSMLGLLPGVGVLRLAHLRTLRYSVVIFTATAIGLSAALADTGALALMTGALTDWMGPLVTGPRSAAVVLYSAAFVYHLFLGVESSLISATMPAILQFARDHALPVVPVGFIWTFAASGKVFAYQSAVLMVGYATGVFTPRDLAQFGLVMTLAECVVLLAIVTFYWPVVGLL